ncbi:MAG: hypothetical protein EWV75_03690 [Microcystis wesenbergii Mw_QC_S_20081001_S30D]|uniref:Uncharacterized protein n=1 Tax=Microcystis wesenbergii Mw_QC_S_20081001_S30D TaxID=2486245 RepID=A0A552JWL4_9CHRO|nr:MAG: hypothetical protein EWV74_20770 [Microcystis wesenbergii Mw_QC_S_20081001_S30]TRU98629.1 MAG: hypothetical protein EWV73_14715 [Microcystis wesenbergii Mw_QC_B_20070930_S4D]TRV00138.1 MAG: hypothetical protein EWV75_03690 [Microcystis wesenbergii Mw_QC_S_20081001_S30D]TRV13245.1 MAG: hypothetical protein EWV89_11645 [Microcystis wesenbergii Mw_QC_B_20070930_S4]
MLKIVRHPPYQGGIKGGSKAKSIFYLIRTTYLAVILSGQVGSFPFREWFVDTKLGYTLSLVGNAASFLT